MRICGRACEREAERRGGEEREGASSRSLEGVRIDNSVRFGKEQSTCLADAHPFRGCAGLGLGTDVPREGFSTEPMYQPQSLCRDYPKMKGSEVE